MIALGLGKIGLYGLFSGTQLFSVDGNIATSELTNPFVFTETEPSKMKDFRNLTVRLPR